MLIDFPYLYLNKNFYQTATKKISGKPFTNRYYSAVFVYIALAIGIIVFVLPRIRKKGTFTNKLLDSIKYAGLFGIVVYATFDFTTHFMFDDWNIIVTLVDTLWGGVLCILATLLIIYSSLLIVTLFESLFDSLDYLENIE
jgi:uncharacterized membrane protein